MNWEYKEALNAYKPTLNEHIALKRLKPTLTALIQYADDFCITEVGARTIGHDLSKRPNTISSHIQELVELGFVVILDKKGKFGKKNLKQLTLPNVSVNVTDNVSVNVTDNVTDNVSVNVTDNVTPKTDTEGKSSKGKEREGKNINAPLRFATLSLKSSQDNQAHKPRSVLLDVESKYGDELDNEVLLEVIQRFIEYRDEMYVSTKDKKYSLKTSRAVAGFINEISEVENIDKAFELMEGNEWATFKREWTKEKV